jgi:hypothetical protein
VRRGE